MNSPYVKFNGGSLFSGLQLLFPVRFVESNALRSFKQLVFYALFRASWKFREKRRNPKRRGKSRNMESRWV